LVACGFSLNRVSVQRLTNFLFYFRKNTKIKTEWTLFAFRWCI